MASTENNVSVENDEVPLSKKAKLDDNNVDSLHEKITDLSNFNVDQVLFNNTNRKSVCLKGTFGGYGDGVGIVLLEKTAFEEERLRKGGYFGEKDSLNKVFHNDIYGNYEFCQKAELNAIKTTIIHPATEKHIEKYITHSLYIVNETPEIYKDIVLPYLLDEQLNLQWVYNILEHKSETERIVFEDLDEKNGFVLLPDLKWDGKTVDNLYLLAIVRVHDIKSLRDLRGEHLELLKNIRDKGSKAIEEKYGLHETQLRIYLHYQPLFYHLHVHFTFLQHEAPGIYAERSHILSNVISNIELLPDYYERATLPFTVSENRNLFKVLEKKGVLKRLERFKS